LSHAEFVVTDIKTMM